MKKQYKTLRLILGDQLNLQHSWFDKKDASILYVIMEIRTETDYVWHHIQKVCAFFAAMEQFGQEVKDKGHELVYIRLNDQRNEQNFAGNCNLLIEEFGIEQFQYQMPDEYRLDQEFRAYCNGLKISYKVFDTEHFYTTRGELGSFFYGKKGLLMENFYREMRKKHHILMDRENPVGDKWNYDEANRKKMSKDHFPPAPLLLDNNVSSQYKRITDAKIRTIGSIDIKRFIWPVNRAQSLKLMDYFIENFLPLFGTFQDAMHNQQWSLYHSRLSFSLNTKMLTPREVIEAAVAAWRKNKSEIAINQIEGFVRQILGWREYMRGIYWLKMPGFEKLNFFNNKRKLPDWYWSGETKMNCLKKSISQSLTFAYAHHIHRLMITGNFALLAGIMPDEVDFWYLGIYIDAIQWVELTNTRGMSQYADGGLMASKPYAASANYIHKMSNYCDSCHYKRTLKVGRDACPFNSLYWDFLDRNRDKLQHNSRLSMAYRIWDKMIPDERSQVLLRAAHCLDHIDHL